MNTLLQEKHVYYDKRAVIWVKNGNVKMRPKTLMLSDIDFLINRDNLFARKFDEKIVSLVLEILETALTASPNK
jgi:hypothetical protein